MVRIVGRSGRVARCIRHAGGAPGKIRHRGGSVAPAIRLRVDDTAGGVLARGGGGDTCRILLRNRKTVHRHRLSGDAAGRHSTVLSSFRSFIIDTPLRGSQATYADRNHFTFQRGIQLRDKLLLHTHQQAAHRIVARLRAAGEPTFLHLLQRVGKLRDG